MGLEVGGFEYNDQQRAFSLVLSLLYNDQQNAFSPSLLRSSMCIHRIPQDRYLDIEVLPK